MKDKDNEIQLETDGSLQLLAVHHEPAVPAHRQDAAVGMQQGGHHGRGQTGSHGRQRVVEQERVGGSAAVVASEPDLVHAVVEGHDPVLRHHLTHVVDDPLRGRRKAAFRGTVEDAAENSLPQRQQRLGMGELPFQSVGEERKARADVAHHLGMREVHLLDIGRREADVDHFGTPWPHQKRRLLDRVVSDGDDQVRAVDRLVHVVALGKGGRAHPAFGAAGDRALAHLGVEERDARATDELDQAGRQARPARRRSQHHQRPLGFQDHRGRPIECRRVRDGQVDGVRRHHRDIRRLLAGDVLGQLQMHRPRALLHGDPESVAHQRGDGRGAHDLTGGLGQGPHGRDHVDDLEPRLTAAHDPLLAGDQHHRHGAQMRVGRTGGEVQCSRTERADANSGATGEASVGRRHERRGLLVPGKDQLDPRVAERFHDVEVLLAGHAEDALDTLVLQRGHQQVGSFGHGFGLTGLEHIRYRSSAPAPVDLAPPGAASDTLGSGSSTLEGSGHEHAPIRRPACWRRNFWMGACAGLDTVRLARGCGARLLRIRWSERRCMPRRCAVALTLRPHCSWMRMMCSQQTRLRPSGIVRNGWQFRRSIQQRVDQLGGVGRLGRRSHRHRHAAPSIAEAKLSTSVTMTIRSAAKRRRSCRTTSSPLCRPEAPRATTA